MPLDSFNDLLRHVLSRAGEETDSTSDFDTDAREAGIEAWRDFTTRHPWLGLRREPPGSLLTVAPITAPTITILAAGTSVTGTLSATQSVSLVGRKLRPGGARQWVARITAHAAGTAALTLDAVPETLAAGTALTIFQDEVDLASDLGVFVDGLWTQSGDFIALKGEEWMRASYPDPPDQGWPAKYFARIGKRRVRFSTYPSAVERVEYPYCYEPADPSGASALAIDAYLRPALAELWLALVFQFKGDRRQGQAEARAETKIRRAITYEGRLLTGLGQLSAEMEAAPYQ